MRRFQVAIQRSELLTIADQVGEWEIPILQLVHGAERISIGEPQKDASNYPAAAVEYDRLERRYGEDPATGTTRVASVYGPSPGGIRILLAAIKDAASETNIPESVNGGIAALSDDLNEEIAPPTDEVDEAVESGTPEALPVAPVKAVPKKAAAPVKTAAKQVLPKSPAAKAPVKKGPIPKIAGPGADGATADPLAIDE